jgi:hypothetical protein
MAEEEEFYKDISDLKKELEGVKGRKDVSVKELYNAVQKLAQTMTDILEVFGAAAEQMRLEEKGYEAEAKKHEMIILKLDKVIDQNRTIAEAMVGIVDMIKEKLVAPAKEASLFKPRAEPQSFKPIKPEWQPRPEPMMPRVQPMQPPIAPIAPPPITAPLPEFGMPPMQPAPPPDFDFPEFGLEEEPKKKGLFGMFKK